MRLLKSEKTELAALLEQGAETPEILAEMFAKRLDELRGERGHLWYALVDGVNYTTLGPFSTAGQAEKAAKKLSGNRAFILPGYTAEGLEHHLKAVNEPAKPAGDFQQIAEDAAAFRKGWKGNRKDRKDYVS